MTEVKINDRLERDSDRRTTLLYDKLWTAWRTSRRFTRRAKEPHRGARNLAETGDIFYDSLFQPGGLDLALFDEDDAKSRHDLDILREPISKKDTVPPPKEGFIKKFRHVMSMEVPFHLAYFPGAIQAVEDMLDKGPVCLWTAGDVVGFPSLGLAASKDQLKKLAHGGWGKLKREYPNLYYVAHEVKLLGLDEILTTFKAGGVDTIVIIDDKADNLLSARKRIMKLDSDMRTILVWDLVSLKGEQGYGRASKKPKTFKGTDDQAAEEFGLIIVYSISEVVPKVMDRLSKEGAENIGFVIDHDDVISDDKVTVRLQQEAVRKWLESGGWV